MIAHSSQCKLAHARVRGLVLGLGTLVMMALMSPALAQTEIPPSLSAPNVSARKIFIMLFLMLGPIKILVPFVNLTRDADPVLRRLLATRAMLFSLAALALAGLLDRNILENFEISVPVLALTGGLILFLVALRTVLEQSLPQARLKQKPILPRVGARITQYRGHQGRVVRGWSRDRRRPIRRLARFCSTGILAATIGSRTIKRQCCCTSCASDWRRCRCSFWPIASSPAGR
jgi:hypothetical protein